VGEKGGTLVLVVEGGCGGREETQGADFFWGLQKTTTESILLTFFGGKENEASGMTNR